MENKLTVNRTMTSKTIQFNALFMAIITILGQFGIQITPEVAAAFVTVGNTLVWIYKRLVTDRKKKKAETGDVPL